MATEKLRSNRLKGLNQTQQPIVVDCSESAVNAGVEPNARGRLVGMSESRSAVVVDCQRLEPAINMVLKLHLTPGVSDDDQVELAANIFSLIQALSEVERELGGAGFLLADQKAESGTVILTLRHTNPDGAAERSVKLAFMITNALQQEKLDASVGVLKLLATAVTSSAVRVQLLLAGSRSLSGCEVLAAI